MSQTQPIQRVAVIMAGGSGDRFWPLSRLDRPKQLLRLTNHRSSLLAEAVERITPLIESQHVYIITAEHLVDPVRAAGVGVADANVLGEPAKRNTAGALAFAAAFLTAKYGGDGSALSMAVLTADHIIGDEPQFRATVDCAMSAAEQHDCLTTLGVLPTRPETGYGYIQIRSDALELESAGTPPVYPVAAYHEKPNRERAQEFIDEGNHYWNAGMFFWKAGVFLRELEAVRPEIAKAIKIMTQALRDGDDLPVRAAFEGLKNESIDYALMEHAKHVLLVPADFPWDDIGAWTSLERTLPKDDHNNVAIGDPVLIDTAGSIVYNDAGADKMAVAVVGADNLVVIVTDDAVLVVPKDRAQEVRRAVEELRKRNAKQV